jgi:hypothetical protein
MWEKLQEWALTELQEVKRAPFALAVAFAIGAGVSWYVTNWFHSERFAVLEERLAALKERNPDPIVPVTPYDQSIFTKYSLELVMLQDQKIIKQNGSIDAVTIRFSLRNTTFPEAEVHNVFGNIWVDSTFFIDSTLPPYVVGSDRTEWDVQIPTFPKGGVFAPTPIRVKMPGPNERVIIGAQFVSKETNKRDYMWNLTNDNGRPTTVIVRK